MTIENNNLDISPYANSFLKRLLDIVMSGCLILLFAPIMIIVLILVFLQDFHAPIYINYRRGKNNKIFGCLKIRSMVVNSKEALSEYLKTHEDARKEWAMNQKLHYDPRITRLGNFIRKTSLDELPQLLNVFKGNMSMIGPRPIVDEEIKKYQDNYKYYKAIKPGLSGKWQISGRADLSYNKRISLDVEYVKNCSFTSDLLIMLKTVPVMILGSGAR